jgi:hypothetical protein
MSPSQLAGLEPRARRSRRASVLALVVALIVVGTAGTAFGFWTRATTGNANAQADQLNTGNQPSLTSLSAQNVTIHWSAATTASTGGAVSGYTINRYNAATGGIGTAATSGCSGTVTGTSCTESSVAPGTWYYAVTPVLDNWLGIESARSAAIVVVGPVSQLVFSTQPGGTITGGTAFPTQPVVTAEDAAGNRVTTYAGTVTFSIKSGTGTAGATLSGCSAVLTAGATTFTGCKIDKSGGNYQLRATDGTFTVDSNTFSIGAGAASRLVFTSAPSGNQTVASTATVGPFVLQVQDASGNPVTNASGSPATLGLSSTSTGTTFFTPFFTPTSGGAAAGTVTIPSSASTSSSFFYSDTKAASPTVSASATINGNLLNGSTNGFAMVAGAATTFSLTNPGSRTAGTAFSEQITALDSFGNTASSYTGSKTIVFSGPANAPSGTAPTYPASVSFTAGAGSASTITLVDAQSTALTAAQGAITGTSGAFAVSPGVATNLAWTNPTSANGSAAGLCLFTCTWNTIGRSNNWTAAVSVTDTFGNIVSGLGGTRTVALAKTGGTLSSTSLTVPATGAATSPTFTFTSQGSNSWTTDTVTASSSGLASATVTFNKN